jgi:hypothetical protein
MRTIKFYSAEEITELNSYLSLTGVDLTEKLRSFAKKYKRKLANVGVKFYSMRKTKGVSKRVYNKKQESTLQIENNQVILPYTDLQVDINNKFIIFKLK